MRKILCSVVSVFIVLLSCVSVAPAQTALPVNPGFFRDPLGIPIQLAANFGELRTNHYHMGLDIRTQQRENLPVYAAAEGYISRVYISPSGYGNMLMVTHPNGYATLYAHLNRFYDPLAGWVKEQQYKTKSWEQDIMVPAGLFPVFKGQQIALSGNTGGSEGPHLHFEIRDTFTGYHYNPQLKGIRIPDNIRPVINGFYWYDRRFSTYQEGAHTVAIRPDGTGYTSNPVKVGSPLIGFAIAAKDKTSNSPFYFGIYSAQVWMDDKQVFQFRLDNFDNALSRYVNAGIDYKRMMQGGNKLQYLFVLPGNHLNIFRGTLGDGSLALTDTLVHRVVIKVTDAAGNETVLNTQVQFVPGSDKDPALSKTMFQALPNRPGHFQIPEADFIYSEKAFYDIVPFDMTASAASNLRQLSATIHLGNAYVPIHDYYTVGITYQGREEQKKYAVLQLKSGTSETVIKGKWSGNRLVGKFNKLGNVSIQLDSVPPRLTAVNVKDNMVLPANSGRLVFRTGDNYAADTFKGAVDGQWLLFSQRGTTYTYENDEHFPQGEHILEITVTDVAGNQTVKQYKIIKQ